MSTWSKLQELEAAGKLVRFVPEMRSYEVQKRCLYLSPALHRWVMETPKAVKAMNYHASIYAHLAAFVKGEKIDDYVFMKEVEPIQVDNVWAFRVLSHPQFRIFGAFVLPDVFIATCKTERSQATNKYPTFRAKVKEDWSDLLSGIQRLTSTRFSDYVTSNGAERDPRKSYS